MPNKFERFLKFLKDFTEGRLSHQDEMDLYAWRRLLPKNERAYRNRSSRRKICFMIHKFVDELIWREELIKFLQNDEQLKQMLADMNKNISNKASSIGEQTKPSWSCPVKLTTERSFLTTS